MDVQITRKGDTWQYDPARYSYASGDILKTISGSPSVASNNLRLNNAEVVSMQAFKNANIEFTMTLPTAPTALDDRTWGIRTYAANTTPVAIFSISGTTFSAKVYDRLGVLIGSKTITWDSSWTNASAKYIIRISERNVIFAVGATIVARFEEQVEIKGSTMLTMSPLCLDIDNNNSDNLDVSLLTVF